MIDTFSTVRLRRFPHRPRKNTDVDLEYAVGSGRLYVIGKTMEQQMRLFYALLMVGMISFAVPATAQPRLSWSVIGSGGSLVAPAGPGSAAISSTIGQTLISTQVAPNNTTVYQGFWVPDVWMLVGVGEETEDNQIAEISNYPNPFTLYTNIRFGTPMEGEVKIRVYNLLGELVRTVYADLSVAGSQEVTIYAVDEYGAPLPSGTYLYEVEGTTGSGVPFRSMQSFNITR